MDLLTREEIFKRSRAHGSPSNQDSWVAAVQKVLFEASSDFFKSKNIKLNKDLFFDCEYVNGFIKNFDTESRTLWRKFKQDQRWMLGHKAHRNFFDVVFDFSMVDLQDPMDVDRSESQAHKDANKLIEQAPSHQAVLKAAEKDLRRQGFNDAAHILSLLGQDPVAMGKKLRDFVDGKGQPKSKPISAIDTYRMYLKSNLTVEGFRVIINYTLTNLKSIEFWL